MVLRPVLHAACRSGAKHGIMVGWVFELWWGQTNAGPSSHLTHVLNGTHGQRSPSNDWPRAAVTRQYRPLAPRCHFTTALPRVAWPGHPPPCPPPRVARHPQLTVESPSTRGWHSHWGGEAGTALDCPPWLCLVLFLLLPVPCALLSLCPPLGTTSLPPSPSYRLVNNSAGFCARCTLSCLWRDRWFWAESASCLRSSRLAGQGGGRADAG